MKGKFLIWAAVLCIVSGIAVAEDWKYTAPPQTTDGSTDTQRFGWKDDNSDTPNAMAGFEATGKNGTKFWFRYRIPTLAGQDIPSGTGAVIDDGWTIPIYTSSAYVRCRADSVEITPATADTVYVIGYR